MKRKEFARMIGTLDRCLSEMILASEDTTIDGPDWQTLKHHAEDMIGAGNKILENLKERLNDVVTPSEPIEIWLPTATQPQPTSAVEPITNVVDMVKALNDGVPSEPVAVDWVADSTPRESHSIASDVDYSSVDQQIAAAHLHEQLKDVSAEVKRRNNEPMFPAPTCLFRFGFHAGHKPPYVLHELFPNMIESNETEALGRIADYVSKFPAVELVELWSNNNVYIQTTLRYEPARQLLESIDKIQEYVLRPSITYVAQDSTFRTMNAVRI